MRFAVDASVRVRKPGIDGIVIQVDDERSALSEYWHTIRTKYGEHREPGCNLKLIAPPIGTPISRTMKLADHIHFHGHNSRINVDSADSSTNVVSQERVFSELREKAGLITDETDRDSILARIADLETAHKGVGFLHAYQTFISATADHISVFAPLLPVLAQMLSGN